MIKWELTNTNSQLLKEIKEYEGTKEYQATKGFFKNNKFWVYKDHLGYPTIGYGHLVVSGENFSNGLTEVEAETLLSKDLIKAVNAGRSIAEDFGINDSFIVQLTLVEMVFQLGEVGTRGFKNTLSKLAAKDYKGAASGMLNSKWAKQTPKRVEEMAARIRNLAS